jgi:hypothetical protein
MSGPKWSRCLAACALIAGLALAGCTARQTVTTRPKTDPSPSRSYLSKPVTSGWLRTVGRGSGLVLVFECQKVAAHGKDLPYRFVVFNENPGARSWDDALFVVWQVNVGSQGWGAAGDYPVSNIGNYDFPGLTLRSGESTIHAGALSGREGLGNTPYLSVLTPLLKGGDRDMAAQLASGPPVTVRLE